MTTTMDTALDEMRRTAEAARRAWRAFHECPRDCVEEREILWQHWVRLSAASWSAAEAAHREAVHQCIGKEVAA